MGTAEDTSQYIYDGKSHGFVCRHYGRHSCLILFKCCNEWYPCHKCHNEAILRAEQNAEEPDYSRPLHDHSEDNNTVSEEIDDLQMASSSEPAETRIEAEGQQDAATAGDEVEDNGNVVSGTSDEQSNETFEAHEDKNGVDPGEENESEVPMDVTTSSSAEMAAALVDIRLKCNKCGHDQEFSLDKSFGSYFCEECKLSFEELESNRLHSLDHLEENNAMAKGIDNFEMASSSETAGTSSDLRGLKDDASCSGEVEDSKNVGAGTSEVACNEQSETNNDENSDKRSDDDDSQSVVDSMPHSSAENEKAHSMATALDGIRLKCAKCNREQEFSDECELCSERFAKYYCRLCKLLIEKDVDPYHCHDCGICRVKKKDHFHCKVCKVCMSQSIKESHICSDDRGHDQCAICFEELFSGAIAFSCRHFVHKECAIQLFRSGSNACPLCRKLVFQSDKDKTIAEEARVQIPSNPGIFARLWSRQNTADHVEGQHNTQPSIWQKLRAKLPC